MAWENRSSGRYYYRKERQGKRVRSSYVGNNERAKLIAQFDEIEREQAEQDRQDRRRQAAKEQATDEQIAAFMQVVEEYHKALLLVAGYHQHKRQWRKKRDN